jgi:hypothetical protein
VDIFSRANSNLFPTEAKKVISNAHAPVDMGFGIIIIKKFSHLAKAQGLSASGKKTDNSKNRFWAGIFLSAPVLLI